MEGITGIIGPEGSGKTTLMTAYCCRDIRFGGKVYTFPGYEVIDRNGKVASETILPEQWATLPDNLNGLTIAITEANIFFNSLRFQETVSELFGYLGQQRRKRHLGIVYDVQVWAWFNNRLRELTHVLISCWDLYWTYRGRPGCPPRGTKIVITPRDVKGFYTGRPWSKGRPTLFNAPKYFPFFRTDDTVDPFSGKTKIDIKKHLVSIKDGQVIGSQPGLPAGIGEEGTTAMLSRYAIPNAEETIRQVVENARDMKVEQMPAEEVRALVESNGVTILPQTLGKYLKKLGVRYRETRRGYFYVFS